MPIVNRKRMLISSVLVFALVLAATPVALADPGTSVSIGSAANVPMGDSIDVDIIIDTDNPSLSQGGAVITLTVDPAVVQVTRVFNVLAYNTVGDTTTIVDLWGVPGGVPSTTFAFATVTLSAVGSNGQCSDLDITVIDLVDMAGAPITPSAVIDGTFCIQASNEPIEVTIDIKPGSDPNPLNVKSKGVLPVAILGTAAFDVSDVDPDSLMFFNPNAAGVPGYSEYPLRWALEDVDGDGLVDLVSHFDAENLMAICPTLEPDGTEMELHLVGVLIDGTALEGMDTVRIINKGYAGP